MNYFLPGWQRSKHLCPHFGIKSFLQISPQECGTRNGSNLGFSVFLQKQRYLVGMSSELYSYRHFGQHQQSLAC